MAFHIFHLLLTNGKQNNLICAFWLTQSCTCTKESCPECPRDWEGACSYLQRGQCNTEGKNFLSFMMEEQSGVCQAMPGLVWQIKQFMKSPFSCGTAPGKESGTEVTLPLVLFGQWGAEGNIKPKPSFVSRLGNV